MSRCASYTPSRNADKSRRKRIGIGVGMAHVGFILLLMLMFYITNLSKPIEPPGGSMSICATIPTQSIGETEGQPDAPDAPPDVSTPKPKKPEPKKPEPKKPEPKKPEPKKPEPKKPEPKPPEPKPEVKKTEEPKPPEPKPEVKPEVKKTEEAKPEVKKTEESKLDAKATEDAPKKSKFLSAENINTSGKIVKGTPKPLTVGMKPLPIGPITPVGAVTLDKGALSDAFKGLGNIKFEGIGNGLGIGNGIGDGMMANYFDQIHAIVYRLWSQPSKSLVRDNPTVTVALSVAEDGRVISAKISRKSGVPAMDNSAQALLSHLEKLPAPPSGAINFSVVLEMQ